MKGLSEGVAVLVDDLEFFHVVATSESLTAASRELGSSLPVVSRRLSALERRLDARLVQRGGHPRPGA